MKHVFMDLDGTALIDHRYLPNELIDYIKETHKKDFTFYICTGRPTTSAIQFYKTLELDTPLVCDNGGTISHIKNHNDITRRIDKTLLRQTLKKFEIHIECIYFDDDSDIYITGNHPLFSHLSSHSPDIKEHIITLDSEFLFNPKGAICIATKEGGSSLLEEFNKIDGLSARQWNDPNFPIIEIYQDTISKKDAIIDIQKLFNISNEDCISFGDDINDKEMIEYCGIGIAVNNAIKEIKDSANIISEFTNEESSIAKTLHNLKLNNYKY